MPFVEVSSARDEVPEARTLEAFNSPINLFNGTAPWLGFEAGREPFEEAAVERCVMRNNEIDCLDECVDLVAVQRLPCNHLLRDACDGGDLSGDRLLGLLKAVEGI